MPATGALIGTPASISDRRRAADRAHRGGAVGRQHLGDEAQRVGELLHGRARTGSRARSASRPWPISRRLGPPHAAGLAVGVRAACCSGACSACLVVGAEGVEHLVHAGHAEGGDVEHLGLAPLEQAGAVRRRRGRRPRRDSGRRSAGAAAVDADALVDDAACGRRFLVSERKAALICLRRPANGALGGAAARR